VRFRAPDHIAVETKREFRVHSLGLPVTSQ
jgi:hypothetical protein